MMAAASRLAMAQDLPPGVRLIDGYIPRFEQKREMQARFGSRLEALGREALRRSREGEYLPCSIQILTEADWLIGSTRNVGRVERRLHDLAESLKGSPTDQAAAGEQTADGSWGLCYDAWFLRLYASIDPLKELVARGERPVTALAFLTVIDTPQKVVEHFRRLRTSHVLGNGVDHRKELNLTVTGLGQLLFLPELAALFPTDWPRAEVAAALIAFMDDEWQDPSTGYWGAWYQVGDRVIKTEDLSITFHIVSYRQDPIPHMRKLVRSTAQIRERIYPYGWNDRGTQNCHHAYDVVRLARIGWPHMTTLERAFTQAQMIIMLARTLRLAINWLGEVDVRPYERAAEAYYFCASLLDEIGYLRPSRNFWLEFEFHDAEDLRERMLTQLQRLPQQDPMVHAARRKLEARD